MNAIRLGMITPSSNTVLEPACAAMLHDVPGISAHFARVRVTRIGLDAGAAAQFDLQPMVEAASLLADARVAAICWNGTSASWLGLQQDESVCAAITGETGIAATSASLGTVALFRRAGVARFGLVTPYTQDVQDRIVQVYAGLGFTCVAERHAGIAENFAFAEVPPETLAGMVREVASARPQAISILCTNLDGARIAAELEREIGIPVYDSTACAVWSSLHAAGCDTRGLSAWGRLFAA